MPTPASPIKIGLRFSLMCIDSSKHTHTHKHQSPLKDPKTSNFNDRIKKSSLCLLGLTSEGSIAE
jgi:hypothetical protein